MKSNQRRDLKFQIRKRIIDRKGLRTLARGSIIAALLLSVSCSVISGRLQEQAEPRIPFPALLDNPQEHAGKTVILGGYILETVNKDGKTQVTVLQAPLQLGDEPKSRDDSQGRFIVLYDDLLDPEVYSEGREITVAGTVTGEAVAGTENCPKKCVSIAAVETHLWQSERAYYRQYPYYYDPWPYPYFHWRSQFYFFP